jgi:hypothetical protein
MTQLVPTAAEVMRERICEGGEVRALKSSRRGRVRLLLQVSLGRRLAALLAPDDDRERSRCSEFDTEAELFLAFDRVAAALAR